MKIATALMAFSLSTGVMATEFHANIDHTSCSIVDGKVTRTTSFGKEFIGKFTEVKYVTMEGLAPFIEKASMVSSQLPSADRQFAYSMKHEGKTYTLSTQDSSESMQLVRMITKICR